ncbi:MAG: glycosyltransferase family 4 protein [Anaerolineales bacterium]|nr:glycosyltransferase family 4 protein [Anaerolineales bacterium]
MRFGFHFLGCAAQDDQGLRVRGPLGVFADALASHVDHLDLLLDEKKITSADGIESQTDYCIRSPNISWVSLGPNGGPHSFLKRTATMGRQFCRTAPSWDFVLFREPSRRTPFIRPWIRGIPHVFLLGGDYSGGMHLQRGIYAYSRAWFFTRTLQQAMRSSLVFVNNEVLLEKWTPYAREIHLTRTSTIDEANIIDSPARRFRQPPYTLLYIGRVEPLKGLEFLLEALAALNAQDARYALQIVGSGNDNYIAQLQHKVEGLGVAGQVFWQGYIGRDEILDFYREADCFVLPTLAENLARTIWEAMSQGCPVVTSRLGGQGVFFKHERDLLFCKPQNSQDLAYQIGRLVSEPGLSQQIVEGGLKLVKANTLQIRSKELIDTVSHSLAASKLKR